MFDMTEIIVANAQTVLSCVASENNLALFAIFISILSLCISFYNTVKMNKSTLFVKLHTKYIFEDSTKEVYNEKDLIRVAHKEAEVVVTNNSRRTKYINYIALTYSPLPGQRYFIVSEELKRIEPEEEVKVPIHLKRGYLQENKKPAFVKAIIRDTTGKKWKSKTRIKYSDLRTIIEQKPIEYSERPFPVHKRLNF